jgi:hypothetical protein
VQTAAIGCSCATALIDDDASLCPSAFPVAVLARCHNPDHRRRPALLGVGRPLLPRLRHARRHGAFPITYAADGTHYVAMVVGNPGLIGNGAANASPEYMRPEPASVLWVWRVP